MVEAVVGPGARLPRRLSWLACAGVGVGLLALGASGAHAEDLAHLKQVTAYQTRTYDIVDLRFDRAPDMWAQISNLAPNPTYVERVQMGESDRWLKLPGEAVLSVYLDRASTYNFNGPQVPRARQRLTRRTGNILRAQVNNEHAGRLDFAVAVAAPHKWKVVVQPRSKRVRIAITRRGPLAPVTCDEASTPLVPVGRWNAAYRITSATWMRCAQVARTITNANMVNPPMITPGEWFSIGSFTCKATRANAEGVATGHCRLGKRAFTVQATEITS